MCPKEREKKKKKDNTATNKTLIMKENSDLQKIKRKKS